MSEFEYTDSDYEEEYNLVFYDPEEESLTKYNISLCELYNKKLHGDDNSDVLYHYLVHSRCKILDIDYINDITHDMNNKYHRLDNQTHDIFRNYRQIITRENYIRLEIIEGIYLNTGHCIAILKTFWLRIIQRKWKSIMKERENIIKKRTQQKSLRHREINGKWPSDCLEFPQLKGMLAQLKS